MRQWDLATGQCVMTMDILWAIAHPPAPETYAYLPGAAATAALGEFAVPLPPRADGSWDMYQDFVGGVQFWGHALVSGSGDGVVRMWDSKCFVVPFFSLRLHVLMKDLKCGQGRCTAPLRDILRRFRVCNLTSCIS